MARETSRAPRASLWLCVAHFVLLGCCGPVLGTPKNLVVDTDIDTDDVFALLYLLKQNRSEINLKAVVINANSWTNAGAAVNQVYDLLYMMGREDVLVGVGGEGSIQPDGTIEPDVGGYLPIVDQGRTTAGLCRFRQAIPAGGGGLLDIDTNFGLARELLPQSRRRRYVPRKQATAQQVLLASLSTGTNTLLILGAHTNVAILLETHPEVKSHIEHIYVMGGGVRSSNPAGCCAAGDATCVPAPKCGTIGNLFDAVNTNPYAEFNIFMDPFAAYQVFHSGLPLTLVALDATNTVPLSEAYFSVLGKSTNQRTYEAQYVFQSLKISRDIFFDDSFFQSIFVWDSFAAAVTVSGMRSNHDYTRNEFVEIEPSTVTVVTSNKPYSADDGSNPFFAKKRTPPFGVKQGGVHSGHVQTGIEDPFCLSPDAGGAGVCQDGYTKETNGSDGVSIFLGVRAKPNQDATSPLTRQFYPEFIKALNDPHQTAAFNFPTEFKHYKEVLLTPNFKGGKLGKTVVFDMDMSVGDFVALFYLLKIPREILNVQAITTVGNGWASSSSINIVYDVLHMMGRDDIAVGRGEFFALNQSYPETFGGSAGCKYRQAIPGGRGGSLDHDTLYGLRRDLPRSPRRYTAHNSVRFGAPRDTEFPSRRQPSANEVLAQVFSNSPKVSVITGGPLSNIASFLQSNASYKHQIEELFILGGSVYRQGLGKLGNLFTLPENAVAEFNFFLDPIAAQYVVEAAALTEKVTLVPLDASSKVPLHTRLVRKFQRAAVTPEAKLVATLLATIYRQRKQGDANKFQSRNVLGEVAATVAAANPALVTRWKKERVSVVATGDVSQDGWTQPASPHSSSSQQQPPLRLVSELDGKRFEDDLLAKLNYPKQSAVLGNFEEQVKQWT